MFFTIIELRVLKSVIFLLYNFGGGEQRGLLSENDTVILEKCVDLILEHRRLEVTS